MASLKAVVQQQQARIQHLESELERVGLEYSQRLQELTRKNNELHTCLCNEVCSSEKLRVYLSHLEEFKDKPAEDLHSHIARLKAENNKLLVERTNLCLTIDEVADTIEAAESRILQLTDDNSQLSTQLQRHSTDSATKILHQLAKCIQTLQATHRSHEEALNSYTFHRKDPETKSKIGQLESRIFELEQEKTCLEKLICQTANSA